eukprot:scaffold4869_cov183-Amphora_coffeaeformis.AAC.11
MGPGAPALECGDGPCRNVPLSHEIAIVSPQLKKDVVYDSTPFERFVQIRLFCARVNPQRTIAHSRTNLRTEDTRCVVLSMAVDCMKKETTVQKSLMITVTMEWPFPLATVVPSLRSENTKVTTGVDTYASTDRTFARHFEGYDYLQSVSSIS